MSAWAQIMIGAGLLSSGVLLLASCVNAMGMSFGWNPYGLVGHISKGLMGLGVAIFLVGVALAVMT